MNGGGKDNVQEQAGDGTHQATATELLQQEKEGRRKRKRQMKRKNLQFEDLFISNIPTAEMYERSYMHRDTVTHTLVANKVDFIITASAEGRIKFWKKNKDGIYFVKTYRAHSSDIRGLGLTEDHTKLCSTGIDKTAKFYDVKSFDMVSPLRLDFTPNQVAWLKSDGMVDLVAITDLHSGTVRVYSDEALDAAPTKVINVHDAIVSCIEYNPIARALVTVDVKGNIEYIACDKEEMSLMSKETHPKHITFELKLETDLFALAMNKETPLAMDLHCSPSSQKLAIATATNNVYVLDFKTGKLLRRYNESLDRIQQSFEAGKTFDMDAIDFGRRLAIEQDYLSRLEESSLSVPVSNVVFDASGNFILLPTLLGVKVINLVTNRLVRILGKVEAGDRFLALSLYQGKPKANYQIDRVLAGKNSAAMKQQAEAEEGAEHDTTAVNRLKAGNDATLVCTAFGKNRFYLFTHREPVEATSVDEGRDVFNERPDKLAKTFATSMTVKGINIDVLPDEAIIHTNFGDIVAKLYKKECPRTVNNFVTHAKNGYYNKHVFHRVIKDFMIQTGDPDGDGTGGESIYGSAFEDEFHKHLKHDREFTLSMANCGPDTNGSQFFITTAVAPWLDNRHTVFGRVLNKSSEKVVRQIEAVETDDNDKPLQAVEMLSISIKQ